MSIKNSIGEELPFRAMINCILCDTCHDYVSCTIGGQCKACLIGAQLDNFKDDHIRMNYLENESLREFEYEEHILKGIEDGTYIDYDKLPPRSLYREKLPITRKRIDKAMKSD